jgi:PrtD family type I secretion system ABC transporter
MVRGQKQPFDLSAAMKQHRTAIITLGLMSGLVNLLALTGSMYMMQVYDRVLPSRSVPTLVGLTIVMVILYGAHGGLDFVRTRIMARIGLKIDAALRAKVFDAVLLLPLRSRNEAGGLQPIRDLDQIRGFLSGLGPTAFFDLPWIPLFVLLLALLHPWLGLFALASGLLLVALTLLTEMKTGRPSKEANASGAQRMTFAEASRRNAEVIRAMGMGPGANRIFAQLNGKHLKDQLEVSDAASGIGTVSKIMRMFLQSGMLGLGAWLAVRGEVSAGTIIAGTIMLGRALAPIELAIANWKGFIGARQGYGRLKTLLKTVEAEQDSMPLPRPQEGLRVEGLTVGAPGNPRPIIQSITFDLKAGQGLGIIGPSASGKSTLARALVGVWLPLPRGGQVRLDGATLDQFPAEALGKDIGYLPQDIELFDGSVSQNIARLDTEADSDAVIEAARLAGCHEMILQLPDGYNTRVGEGGAMLSAGQRQRVGLARALFGNPFLVVLDEPNSNLDAIGDFALAQAIKSVRERNGIVIIIAHRPSALAGIDTLLAMANGQVTAFGPKDEVLQKITQAAQGQQRPPQGPGGAPVPATAIAGAPRGQQLLKIVPDGGTAGG